MKTTLAILCLFTAFGARGDEWTKADTAYEAAAVALIMVDWMQTIDFTQNHAGTVRETNPLLGSFPSRSRVNAMIGAALIGHVVIARVLPQKYRRVFQSFTIVLELGATTNNALNGFGFSMPWG